MLAEVLPEPEVQSEGAEPWELERYADMRAEVFRRAKRYRAILALKPEDRARFEAAEHRLCRGADEFDWRALVYFINEYGWVRAEHAPDPRIKNGPFNLWPSQEIACRRLCEFLRDGAPIFILPKSREIGMTWLALHWVLWLWAFHGSSSLLGSKVQNLVDRQGDMKSLFERLRFLLKRTPAFLIPPYFIKFLTLQSLRDTSVSITGEATDENFARGGRARVVVIDEYAAIDAPMASAILRSTESVGPLVLIYNPSGENHPSYRLFTTLPANLILALDWTADPYRPEDFLDHVRKSKKLTEHDIQREYCVSHKPPAEGLIFEYDGAIEYDEDASEWAPVAALARQTWPHVGGWDFGSGTSLLVCIFGLLFFEEGASAPFVLWIDDEREWERAPWYTAAEEAMGVMEGYRGYRWHLGDPAGRQSQADQQSWESHLNGAGIPLHCLDAAYNLFESQEWLIRNVQHMMRAGRLRIHRKKCPHLIKALKSWRRRVREGVEVAHAAGRVPPLKDWPSHACQALLYLCAGVAIFQHSMMRERDASLPAAPETSGPGAREATIRLLEAFQAGRPLG